MASILDLMNHVQQQGEIGTQRAKTSRLGQLLAQGYQQGGDRSQLMGQIAQVDPSAALAAQKSFGAEDDAKMERVGQMASMLVAMPAEARAQAYPQIAQQLHGMGMGQGLPDQWDESMLPTVQQIAQQLGNSGTGGNVQSTYIDAQGNRVAIMRDGTTQILGQNAPSNQIIDTGNGFYGVNKGNLQAAPVTMGGQAPQPAQQRAPGEVPFSIDPSLPPEVQASIRQNEAAFAAVPDGGSVQIGQQGQQLRSAPKPSDVPEVFVPLSSDEIKQMGLPAGTVAQRNLKTGKIEFAPQGVQPQSNGPTPAQAFKIQQTQRKEKQLLSANDAGIDQTVKLIDSILARKGELAGVTGMGRIGSMIPGTDWADVAAKLDTLKGRSAFGALQQMRANSPTGGALGQVSERELYLLQNAETQLQNSQSPEALAQALADYKAALLESKRRMREGVDEFYSEQGQQPAQGGGVDDLLSKYGVK